MTAMPVDPFTPEQQTRLARMEAATPVDIAADVREEAPVCPCGHPGKAHPASLEGACGAPDCFCQMFGEPAESPADTREDARTDWAAIVMCEKADRWYWAEREVCGVTSDTESPCVKSPHHDGAHDATYRASARERLDAWLAHEAESAQDGAR